LFAEYIQAASGKAVYQFNVLLASPTSPATIAFKCKDASFFGNKLKIPITSCCSNSFNRPIRLFNVIQFVNIPPNHQGMRFAIREGGRTIGAGVVSKIIK
jgi:hypothetical protein